MSTFNLDTLQIMVEPMPARGITLLRLAGQIDSRTADQLDKSLQTLFERTQYRIVMDMSDVTHITSVGVGVFVEAISRVQERGGDLVFIHIHEATCGHALKLVGVWDMMKRADNLPAALTMFGHASSSGMGVGVEKQ